VSAVLLKTITEARLAIAAARRRGLEIGFVPTMGALHEGHGELIRRAKAENGFAIVSVFVNPIQFDRNDDFQSYPRTLANDLEFCSSVGADAVFAPAAEEMYPSRPLTFVEVSELGDGLCGAFRPGHFRGVATVVSKLLNITDPDRAYFGEKDAQQLAIIERMAADLNFRCAIVPAPTVREADGLALSSRNRKLSAQERSVAPAIYRGLQAAATALRTGSGPDEALSAARCVIEEAGGTRIEYLEIVDPATMKPVQRVEGPVRIIAAVWLGNTRLIDNLLCAFER
jgi:pantoate--beta-alanine ligase